MLTSKTRNMLKLPLVDVTSDVLVELDDISLLRMFSHKYSLRFVFYLQCGGHRQGTLLTFICIVIIFSPLA